MWEQRFGPEGVRERQPSQARSGHPIDNLARWLASPVSRRRALRLGAGAVAGMVLGSRRPRAAFAQSGGPICAQETKFCRGWGCDGPSERHPLGWTCCYLPPDPNIHTQCPTGGCCDPCNPDASQCDGSGHCVPGPVAEGCTTACQGPANRITSVETASGNDLGLTNTSFRPGQRITASEVTRLQLGDGSRLVLDKGTSLKIDTCPFKESTVIELLTGRLWTAVKRAVGAPEFKVETERAVTGPRGTTYWISYAPAKKRTTVHVIKGSVELRQRFGAKRKLLVRASQTAVQQGNGRPRFTKR